MSHIHLWWSRRPQPPVPLSRPLTRPVAAFNPSPHVVVVVVDPFPLWDHSTSYILVL